MMLTNIRYKQTRLKNILMIVVWLIIMIAFSSLKEAHATCSFINGASKATLRVSPGNFTRLPTNVSRNSTSYPTAGYVLAGLFNISNSNINIVNCTAGEKLIIGNSEFPFDASASALASNLKGVYFDAQGQYPTVWIYPNNGGNYEKTLDSSGNINSNFLVNTSTLSGYVVNHVVLVGQMAVGGRVNGGLFYNMTTSDGLDILDVYVNSFSVSVPTCTVNSYDSSVELGWAFTQRLKSVGTTSNKTPFTINMACASTSLNPTITFTGNTVTNYPSVLANTGTAQGVGIQLLYQNNVITPNTSTSLGKVATTSSTDYNFDVQYYQTASPVTAGTVDVIATFTISYE